MKQFMGFKASATANVGGTNADPVTLGAATSPEMLGTALPGLWKDGRYDCKDVSPVPDKAQIDVLVHQSQELIFREQLVHPDMVEHPLASAMLS